MSDHPAAVPVGMNVRHDPDAMVAYCVDCGGRARHSPNQWRPNRWVHVATDSEGCP